MRFALLSGFALLVSLLITGAVAQAGQAEPGQLTIVGRDGKAGALCPLRGTTVAADIAGFGARVTVVQTYVNPTNAPVEAIYTFPLPHDAAVDRMRMKVGNRVVVGVIKERAAAQAIYEVAKQQGKVASLLEQERPNIFRQSVANIVPGAVVEIEISYVQILKYAEGQFEFVFPMVVGPRYLGHTPDAGKIDPPAAAPGTRTGSDIRLTVSLDAGSTIQELTSVQHEVDVRRVAPARAVISLRRQDEIPNRDFILRYRLSTGSVASALLTYASSKGGYFALILMPPREPAVDQVSPKEMIFVIDRSGSQKGFPIEKSKELTKKLIDTMRPDDTFNVISFSNETAQLWGHPMKATEEMRILGKQYVDGLQADGGTELLKAVMAALSPPKDPDRLRIVVFNTDGFIGDEYPVLDAIQKNRDTARMFTFGIGGSVNRFLIDAMSAEGRGDAEYVTLAESADEAVARFARRVQTPLLRDINVRFDGVQVTDVFPKAIPDVFTEKPVILIGRYAAAGHGQIAISGTMGRTSWSRKLDATFPALDQSGSAIASLWARAKIDDLMRQDWLSHRPGEKPTDQTRQITDLALDFGLMTQYTSFVAVEQRVVNFGGQQRTVRVPVQMAEGVFGEGSEADRKSLRQNYFRSAGNTPAGGTGGGYGGYAGDPTQTVQGLNGNIVAAQRLQSTGGVATLSKGTMVTAGKSAHEFLRESTDYTLDADGRAIARLGDEKLNADQILAAVYGLQPTERAKYLASADGKKAMAKVKPVERRKYLFELRVARSLRDLKSPTADIQVWLSSWRPSDIEALRKLGLRIASKDQGRMLLLGTVPTAKLIDLAQIESVNKVLPLEP